MTLLAFVAIPDSSAAHPAMWPQNHLYTVDWLHRRGMHQQIHFAVVITATEMVHISQVGQIHPNQEVVLVAVLVPQLTGYFPVQLSLYSNILHRAGG